MERLGQSPPSLDELKQIQNEARASKSLKQLRSSFDRIQELRRIHASNFDVQLVAAEAQEEIIERARELRSRSGDPLEQEDLFSAPLPAREGRGEPLPEPPEEFGDEGNRQSWRRATYLALFLTAAILIVFFYLIQTARRINLPAAADTTAKTTAAAKPSLQTTSSPAEAVNTAPTLRLYTDLIPGTVSIDDGEPQDLTDGELVLDHLEPGRHSVRVAGRSGSADFSFDVSPGSAPQAIAPISTSNAMAVLVSAKDGKGHLLTSVQQPTISLDGKLLGQAGADGLALDDLGNSDHELQVTEANDRQRFVMTYTAAPVLTAYVKSDLNAGTVTVLTKLDGVNIFVNDKPYRRPTDHGQIRIPLKVGGYVIRVHKDGFVDPAPQSVNVKKGEETELSFDMQPLENLASLEIRDAAPGTAVLVDKTQVASVGADGIATAARLKTGDHSIELRLKGSIPKKFDRTFQPSKTVLLSGSQVALDKAAPVGKPTETAASSPTAPVTDTKAAAPVSADSAPSQDVPGEHVRRGGGFVHYGTPKAAGRYTFKARSKIGGFLKHDKLQWYAGYENSENYIMFTLDGKHASVRQMKDGKSSEVNRIRFNADSGEPVQVDLSVSSDAISARIRTPDGAWNELGTVSSSGRNFTQDRVGLYIPGNDEVTVSNFHFTPR